MNNSENEMFYKSIYLKIDLADTAANPIDIRYSCDIFKIFLMSYLEIKGLENKNEKKNGNQKTRTFIQYDLFASEL